MPIESKATLSLQKKSCYWKSRDSNILVIIDSVAVLQAKEHWRKLHMGYIDYKQPYSLVPNVY